MEDYGCNDCSYLVWENGDWCELWDIEICDPVNSHCESAKIKTKV